MTIAKDNELHETNSEVNNSEVSKKYSSEFIQAYYAHLDDCDDFYGNTEEDNDYGPSNPWDAPGMSISDFCNFPVCPF